MANDKTGSTLIPCIRYHDAPVAIEWLCRNFGFEKQLVVPAGNGIAHAQLVRGGGMLMLGSIDEKSEYGKQIRQPDEIGGFETQASYLVVDDADAVYRKVKDDGGEIVIEIKDEDYGGRGFTCRDLEGRLWSIGTYDPWKG